LVRKIVISTLLRDNQDYNPLNLETSEKARSVGKLPEESEYAEIQDEARGLCNPRGGFSSISEAEFLSVLPTCSKLLPRSMAVLEVSRAIAGL
jgi:hypothetical protein